MLADDASSGGTTLTLGPVTLSGGTLGGTGAVGLINQSATASTIAPGDKSTTLGVPFYSSVPPGGSETWSNATTYNAVLTNPDVSVGTPGTGHSWLQVNGSLNINNATLLVTPVGITLPRSLLHDHRNVRRERSRGPSSMPTTTGSTVIFGGQQATVTYNSTSVVLTFSTSVTLTFVTQPLSTTAGTTLNAVTVQAVNQFGADVAGATINIAISPGALSGGTTALVTNASGDAVFTDLVEDIAGTYMLAASANGFTSVNSNPFTISPSSASELIFVNQPSTTAAGATIGPLTVSIADKYGNAITTGSAVNVSISITAGFR